MKGMVWKLLYERKCHPAGVETATEKWGGEVLIDHSSNFDKIISSDCYYEIVKYIIVHKKL